MELLPSLRSLLNLESLQNTEEETPDLIPGLVEDVSLEIVCHINLGTLNRYLLVNKQWNQLFNTDALFREVIYRTFAFNKEKWAKYHGDIEQEMPLPADIRKILKESHNIFKKYYASIAQISIEQMTIAPVQKLFKLIFIPQTIDGKDFDIPMYGELVALAKEGNLNQSGVWTKSGTKSAFRHLDCPREVTYSPVLSGGLGQWSLTPPPSCWKLVATRVIKVTEENISATFPGFETPRVLDAVAVNFTEYVETDIRLFGDEPYTYTYAKFGERQIMGVGGFTSDGLAVSDSSYGTVALCRTVS